MWLKATAGQTPQTDRCRIPYRTPNRSGRQEPMVSRIYVEKKPGFDVEAQQLKGELTEILGIKGIEVRHLVNQLRRDGVPIASSGSGYFYAATEQEVRATIAHLTRRISGIAAAIRGLDRTLEREDTAQTRLPLDGGDTP